MVMARVNDNGQGGDRPKRKKCPFYRGFLQVDATRKAAPLPAFYSGAAGIPGRFSEGLLLRRLQFGG